MHFVKNFLEQVVAPLHDGIGGAIDANHGIGTLVHGAATHNFVPIHALPFLPELFFVLGFVMVVSAFSNLWQLWSKKSKGKFRVVTNEDENTFDEEADLNWRIAIEILKLLAGVLLCLTLFARLSVFFAMHTPIIGFGILGVMLSLNIMRQVYNLIHDDKISKPEDKTNKITLALDIVILVALVAMLVVFLGISLSNPVGVSIFVAASIVFATISFARLAMAASNFYNYMTDQRTEHPNGTVGVSPLLGVEPCPAAPAKTVPENKAAAAPSEAEAHPLLRHVLGENDDGEGLDLIDDDVIWPPFNAAPHPGHPNTR